ALLDRVYEVGSGAQELHSLLLPLTQPHLAVTEPTTRLLHHLQVRSHLHQVPQLVDATTEQDVHLSLTERRRHLVLRHLHPRTRTVTASALLPDPLTPGHPSYAG